LCTAVGRAVIPEAFAMGVDGSSDDAHRTCLFGSYKFRSLNGLQTAYRVGYSLYLSAIDVGQGGAWALDPTYKWHFQDD
jgi:hypothetical protein